MWRGERSQYQVLSFSSWDQISVISLQTLQCHSWGEPHMSSRWLCVCCPHNVWWAPSSWGWFSGGHMVSGFMVLFHGFIPWFLFYQFHTGLVAKSCLTFVTPWTVVHQAPLSMEFFRQEYGVSTCFLLQEIFPTQGSHLGLLHCRWILYQLNHQGSLVSD